MDSEAASYSLISLECDTEGPVDVRRNHIGWETRCRMQL